MIRPVRIYKNNQQCDRRTVYGGFIAFDGVSYYVSVNLILSLLQFFLSAAPDDLSRCGRSVSVFYPVVPFRRLFGLGNGAG